MSSTRADLPQNVPHCKSVQPPSLVDRCEVCNARVGADVEVLSWRCLECERETCSACVGDSDWGDEGGGVTCRDCVRSWDDVEADAADMANDAAKAGGR